MDSRLTAENFLAMIGKYGCPKTLHICDMLNIQARYLVNDLRCNTSIVIDLDQSFTGPDGTCGIPWEAEYDTGVIRGDGSNL